uniref:Uncharacterized protein n=1 Tax=Rhodnius prolixus TaxID=13249 RepID=T1HUC7_RHOPR
MLFWRKCILHLVEIFIVIKQITHNCFDLKSPVFEDDGIHDKVAAIKDIAIKSQDKISKEDNTNRTGDIAIQNLKNWEEDRFGFSLRDSGFPPSSC